MALAIIAMSWVIREAKITIIKLRASNNDLKLKLSIVTDQRNRARKLNKTVTNK